jgi:hypothetical protein
VGGGGWNPPFLTRWGQQPLAFAVPHLRPASLYPACPWQPSQQRGGDRPAAGIWGNTPRTLQVPIHRGGGPAGCGMDVIRTLKDAQASKSACHGRGITRRAQTHRIPRWRPFRSSRPPSSIRPETASTATAVADRCRTCGSEFDQSRSVAEARDGECLRPGVRPGRPEPRHEPGPATSPAGLLRPSRIRASRAAWVSGSSS